MKRKMAGMVVAASLLGGAAVGVVTTPMAAFADTSSSTAATTDRSPVQWVSDSLKGLVDKGTITQQQSDAVAQALKDAGPPKGMHGGPGRAGFMAPAELAKALGMTEDELQTATESGKTPAEIAKERGVDVQKVIDALVAAENTRLDQAVTDGRLTQAQADERKSEVKDRITDAVNNAKLRMHRFDGGPGRDGDGPDGAGVPDGAGDDAPSAGGTTSTSAA